MSITNDEWQMPNANECGRHVTLIRHSAFVIRYRLEIVANPDAELRPPQPLAAAAEAVDGRVVGIHVVFPALVEQRPPRPVEVDREAEREGLEADAVGGAAVDQTQAAKRVGRPEGRRDVAGEEVLRVAGNRRHLLRAAIEDLQL